MGFGIDRGVSDQSGKELAHEVTDFPIARVPALVA
eukprot:COSAG02_NODE_56859_length_283_cov_0.847826_1_plen_34_part_10